MTLKVRAIEDLAVTAISMPTAQNLADLIQDIIAKKLPLWSILFINPKMAELKNEAPLRMHLGHAAEHRVLLPKAYIAVLAYRTKDRAAFGAAFPEILRTHGGFLLSQEIADHEWTNRFKLMIVKRLGPSLVPAEIVVPLENLGRVLSEIEAKVSQPVVKEGVIVRAGRDGKPEVVILGFVPSDQRKFLYNFVFGLVLSIMKIAEKHGGRPYLTGLYFTGRIDKILGPDRARRLKDYKKRVDAAGILNPDKVFGGKLISRAFGWASAFEPVIRRFGNKTAVLVGERFAVKPQRGIPADVAWYAYACSQCGYCVDECDQFYGRGWESQSPRGKWFWLREFLEGRADWDQKAVDTFLVCTTCELCNLRCSASLPIESSWMKLRGKLIEDDKKMTFPPFEMMAAATRAEDDIWAGYRKNRSDWFPQALKDKHGPGVRSNNVYFGGCTVSYKAIPGVEFVEMAHHHENAHCCGGVLTLIKDPLIAHDIGEMRIGEATAVGAETILALCPCCEFQLRVTKEKKNSPVEIRDLAAFACESLGHKFADPSPEVSRQWKVFEGMIALMTPRGFADLMATMWPELLKAMPLGMGAMMKGIGKLGPVGGFLFALMKPMFPVLFPMLLPGMMPKVMDNLMPHMLPDVVPLIVPRMIAYLRGRA